ncbi:MAG: hypothetical protein ACO3BH_10990 [Quisquiliibacterium sp.]
MLELGRAQRANHEVRAAQNRATTRQRGEHRVNSLHGHQNTSPDAHIGRSHRPALLGICTT